MKIPRDDVRKDLVYFNKKIKDCKDKIHNLEKTIKCHKEDIKDLEYALENDYHNG